MKSYFYYWLQEISPSVYQLRGFTPEEVMQQPIEEVLCPNSIQVVINVMENALKNIASGIILPGRLYELEQPGRGAKILPDCYHR